MRKTTALTLFISAVVALGCGSGTATESGDSGGDTGTDKATKTAKIGQAARDGKFEFVVKSAKCGVSKIGDDLLGKQAQGQFCLVTVTVKNIGKEAQMFSDSSQKAYTADGTEYSTDSGAALYANKNAETFLNDINPGNRVTGVLVFDIPKKVTLAKLELHDSPFSGGVTVSLK